MITFFTVPKPFAARTAMLQENALASWRRADPDGEVLVFGDEPGAAAAAAAAGAVHIPDIARTDHGTPRVDDLFRRAAELAANDLLCFVNADVIVPPSFRDSVARVARELPSAVVVGQCRDVLVDRRVAGWDGRLDAEAVVAPLRGPGGIDFVVFPRGAFDDMPPFAVGRAHFDNWLLWSARRRGLPVVDVTEVVPAVHQRHEYRHVEGGKAEAYFGAEASRNFALAGSRVRLFNIDDATHRLATDGLHRRLSAPLRANRAVRWSVLAAGRVGRAVRRSARA